MFLSRNIWYQIQLLNWFIEGTLCSIKVRTFLFLSLVSLSLNILCTCFIYTTITKYIWTFHKLCSVICCSCDKSFFFFCVSFSVFDTKIKMLLQTLNVTWSCDKTVTKSKKHEERMEKRKKEKLDVLMGEQSKT